MALTSTGIDSAAERSMMSLFYLNNSYSKKSQTLRQNHTVLPRAALSGPEKGAGQSSMAGRYLASCYKIGVLDCPPFF
jgi:hypothetical protein